MNKKLQKKEKGFTIIEVLIVLAIAGLIMLIVFLAVPALQRNSRNSQRTNDVSRLAGAVQEYINTNRSQLPTSGDIDTVLELAGDLAYYVPVEGSNVVSIASSPGTNSDEDTVQIVVGARCGESDSGQQAAVTGSSRSFAIIYAVETGGSPTPQCTDS